RRRGIEDALERTGLQSHADVRVSGYSAGMRQRLGLASALLRAPDLLLLDEPTSALDPRGARDVRALAREVASNGAAVVCRRHDLAEVEELCSLLTILDHGRVIFSGTLADLRARAPQPIHLLRTSDDDEARRIAFERAIPLEPAANGGLEVAADP